ncbi:MAG TPA: molybdopterin cofactor-binding domain-containing protein [Bryobacteraceae bacterium]|nr:molybdopterin cofactor-binding domain-containing protein [Bryobacteraceae bacterium]
MIEFERYELREGPAYRFELERREFFKLLGGGLILLLVFDRPGEAQESGRAQAMRGDARPPEIAAWLHIAEDGSISVYTGKAEMGQNIRTSLTQAIAEELHAPVSSIRLVMADTAMTPYDMGTFGSRTTPTMAPQLRKVGAAAREALIDLAAEKWKVGRSSISVVDGKVKNAASGESIGFGELTKGRQIMNSVNGAVLTPAEKWTVAGSSAAKVNARDIVTGAHRYASDITRPGMLHGRILRPGVFQAKLTSVDTKAAEAIPGASIVRGVDFIGAVAEDESTAAKAIAAIQALWQSAQQPSNKDLFTYLKAHTTPAQPGAPRSTPERSIEDSLASADHKLDATYTVAYIAHIPLEPRAAVAEWNEDNLTVWTGTQRPFGVRSELSEAFALPENKIRVIVPDTGSGYGGKHTGEVAIEAARLAKSAGKPVKLIWTREEEFTWAYFRPAGVIDIRSGASSDGVITAWEFHNYNSGPSGIEAPYDIAHRKIEFHPTASPLRQGSYRGLAATANHFARESHMDDLAAAAGLDPLDFRLKNLKNARLRAVLEAAAEKFGWRNAKSTPARGFGLACGVEKGGYVASCAELSIAPPGGKVKIERVVTAFECGAIVNPEHLKNQVEGAVVMGIGGALFEAIEFADGRILNGQLSQYRVPRFSDLPVLETILLDRKDLPSAGAGETPIVALAPAVGNAIFHATGRRLRSLPMAPNGLPSGAHATA